MKKKLVLAMMCMLVLLGLLAVKPAAADVPAFSLAWWTIDSGGTTDSRGGTYVLNGSVAQPDAGQMVASRTYRLEGGFWENTAPNEAPKYIFVPSVRR